MASIAAMVDLDESEDPETLYQQRVVRREQLMGGLREKLADDPEQMAKFDELYEAARYSFPLTEDHAFYIDQLYISVFRRFALAVGDRLVEKGVIDAADDVFFLYSRRGGRGASLRRRSARIGRGAASQLRPRLRGGAADRAGHAASPPEVPDPFMDALVYRLLGMVPPEDNPDPNVLRAVAGSPGTYTGVARVVRSLAGAIDELEEGEVMVCEMTLPPWVPLFSVAGAIVSDVGGVLSHSAIVAREFAIPAVVGTNVGTIVIQTGQTVTVDGNAGVVYLDGREV